MHRAVVIAAFAGLLFGITGLAAAQQPRVPPATASGEYPGTEQQRAACTMDVFRLCAFYIPNVNNIVICLRQRTPELSPACRTVFENGTPQAAR